jgi:hypothetical protein
MDGAKAHVGGRMTSEPQRRDTTVELLPDLSHCVQTRARQEYNTIAGKIMSGDPSPELEPILELLKAFLEEADFGRLRRESEAHLTQGRKVKFLLSGSTGHAEWSARMTVEDSA